MLFRSWLAERFRGAVVWKAGSKVLASISNDEANPVSCTPADGRDGKVTCVTCATTALKLRSTCRVSWKVVKNVDSDMAAMVI